MLATEATMMASRGDIQKRRIWEDRLQRFRASGLAVTTFCERERVPVHSFYYWSKRIETTSARITRTSSVSKRRGQTVRQVPGVYEDAQAAVVRFHLHGVD